MATEKINIVVADAQFLVRNGLINLIHSAKNMSVVGTANNSEELHKNICLFSPDIVIIDYAQMPHFSIDDLKILKTRNPSVHILVISQDNDKKNIYQAIDYGVLSFLTKECDQEEILNAIFATAKGQKFLCHKVIDIIIEKHSHTGEDLCKAINLSDRETEIIKLTAKGWQTKNIAYHLFLSIHTVYTHKKNIMKKLNINSTSEMIVYAMQSGFVEKEELV